MGIKDRLKRLEGRREPEYCLECDGKIIFQKRHPDGTVTYPEGNEPCAACNNAGWGGAVGVIEVVLGGGGTPSEGEEAGTHSLYVWP